MICLHCGAPEQFGTDCEECALPLVRNSALNRLHMPPDDSLHICPICKGRGIVRSELDVPATCTGCRGVGHVAA